MSTRLLLMRHGRSTWNAAARWQGQADPPLDDTGRMQAHRLAERLRALDEQPVALYTSPLRRAAETADIVGAAVGLTPVPDDRLMEFHVGDLEGLTQAEVEQRFPELWARWQTSDEWIPTPGGEDRQAFHDRVAAAVEAIVARHPDQTAAIVTHGGVLGAYLRHALGVPPLRLNPFAFSNASLSVLDHNPRRRRLMLLNDTCHLREGA